MAGRIAKSRISSANSVQDPTRKVWLAGLGAVAIAKQRGAVAMEDLAAGAQTLQTKLQAVRSRVQHQARKRIEVVTKPITAAFEQRAEAATDAIELGVGKILGRLGVPSKADIEELSQRVAVLSRQLRAASR